jgi:uncharacterized protein (DUF1501 family)
MKHSRRAFMQGGVAAFTYSFAAPSFLCRLAEAQGQASRSLVVLDLTGGNDSLSMLIPYNDSYYYSRRPTLAVPAGNVLQIGSDSSGVQLGLHPRLTGIKDIFNQGRLAFIQRTGYENSSRSHFMGTDIWSTANPANTQGNGWLGRYLDSLGANQDPLAAWNTFSQTPHSLQANTVGVPSISDPARYAFNSPNTGSDAALERTTTQNIASHIPVGQPHVAFVCGVAGDAMATLDRVATVATYAPTVSYPTNGLGAALKAIAGAMNKGIGTKVFWVQLGGFDTHSNQQVVQNNGAYMNLMAALNDGLLAFYNDLSNQGLLSQTMILQFSEFGRRITENGSGGCDHGAAGIMMALGGTVRGGLYGTAASLRQDAANPTLENNAADVKFETDFRSVYAKVIDNWLGANSVSLLGGDFKAGAPNIL